MKNLFTQEKKKRKKEKKIQCPSQLRVVEQGEPSLLSKGSIRVY